MLAVFCKRLVLVDEGNAAVFCGVCYFTTGSILVYAVSLTNVSGIAVGYAYRAYVS